MSTILTDICKVYYLQIITMLSLQWMHRPLCIAFSRNSSGFRIVSRTLKRHRNVEPHWQSRLFSAAANETLSPPAVEGQDKVYPPKIVQMVDEISQLTLLEVGELNELLKLRLNISDVPMMSAAAPASQSQDKDEEDAPAAKEQTEFLVKLTAFKPDSKVKVIKAIKGLIPDCSLVKAKGFVESVPQIVNRDISKEEAEEIFKVLTEAGGTAVIE